MIRRRNFVAGASGLPLLTGLSTSVPAAMKDTRTEAQTSRVRPGDSAWPGPARWDELNRQTQGRLIKVQSPLTACQDLPGSATCTDVFKKLKNPYYIGDQPALTQTSGWVDAWTSQPSVYAVAAESTADVVATVNFARDNNLRLVVKGGGHSYLGTSNAADSVLIWTRHMHDITLHDAFVAQGCAGTEPPKPAVTVGAGAIWMHTYHEVTSRGGRYVQGGGCGTVGVAGLVQGGGFGSYSKTYGSAAASLLEAEIVTADGMVRIANSCINPDLYWALKGGGGGSFGVVTRMTLRTHELPPFFGAVATTIVAASEAAFRKLLGRFIAFYAESLFNPHWGEIVTIRPGNRLDIRMEFQGLNQQQAETIWQPFLNWISVLKDEFSFRLAPSIRDVAARVRWDPPFLKAYAPGAILSDDRPGAPPENIFWSSNLSETGHFLYGFESVWLPGSLLSTDKQDRLADALLAASRHWSVELHFQKGLAGAPAEAIAATADTAMNRAVLDAFVLAIIAGEGPPSFPGLPGHEPDLAGARRRATEIGQAMAELKKVAPDPGSYVAESSFFQTGWQQSYWGSNYAKLLAVKQKYDPDGLLFVHHGVGSEAWSADGFTRLTAP
jgi:FAD/FMN-containing dehydrogenase